MKSATGKKRIAAVTGRATEFESESITLGTLVQLAVESREYCQFPSDRESDPFALIAMPQSESPSRSENVLANRSETNSPPGLELSSTTADKIVSPFVKGASFTGVILNSIVFGD